MNFLRRLFNADTTVTPEMRQRAEDSERTLDDERGALRQTVQNINAGERLMLTWADANRMVRGGRQ